MTHYPVFLDLRSQPVLIVGAGRTAAGKARELLASGAQLTVVAPAICRQMLELQDQHPRRLTIRVMSFERENFAVDDPFRVIMAATGRREVDEQARVLALKHNSLFLDATRSGNGNFVTPAVIRRGQVQIAVVTGGVPVLSRILRQKLERWLPANIGVLASLLTWLRHRLRSGRLNRLEQRRFQEQLCSPEFIESVGDRHDQKAESMLLARLDEWLRHSQQDRTDGITARGKVYLVGAGPGDAGMLTLRAHQVMQQADIVLHDQLVSADVMALCRRDADRIAVGKAAGGHSTSQTYINRMMVRLAREGKRVVRLKGGDPFVYGRGGEELLHLVQNGIENEVVPGISAAIGSAAVSGIPLTHRDLAHSFSLVAGHLRKGAEPDWQSLGRQGQTLVFYMGLARAGLISDRLIAQGQNSDTPVAIIERGTTAQQRVVTGELSGLAQLAERHQIESPALLIVGDVVKVYHEINGSGSNEAGEHLATADADNTAIHAA